MDSVYLFIVAFALAAMWGVAGLHKLAAFAVFAATLDDYRVVPQRLVRLVAGFVVAIELIIALCLTVPGTRSAALITGAVLLSIYAAAMAINLVRGRRHIDCGCMGPAGRQTLSGWLITRNIVIALLAVASTSTVTYRAFVWLDAFTIGAGVAVLALAYASANHLIANAPELARLRHSA